MRYIVAILVVIALIIFGVVVLGGSNEPKPIPAVPKSLMDYAVTDASARVTIDGRINGDDKHRAVRITVSRNERKVEVIQGYEGNVIQSQSYANNQEAYTNFLSAINRAGFSKERKTADKDERGVCPQGFRYIFELSNTNNGDMRRWSASCVGFGTFGGQTTLVRSLFQAQITDYDKIIAPVQL